MSLPGDGTSQVGAATVDVTPPAGLAMSGFLARTSRATGAHDPLTVRAVTVDGTAVVTVDACGLHEDTCRRIRERLRGEVADAVVAATHTHGGPAVVPGRLGGPVDPGHLRLLEDACVDAVRTALHHARPARLRFGSGADPGVARNRRRHGGPVDSALPVLVWTDETGATVTILTAYACHPVVLGADNTLWTADYPGVVRRQLELAHPGAVAVFLTGCCGDANTGHSADASTLRASDTRTYGACERVGTAVAQAVLDTRTCPVEGPVGARSAELDLERLDGSSWTGRVSVLDWCGIRLVALPGEPFAATAMALRCAAPDPLAVFGYADGCPGYFPTREEYALGGYEVEQAHLYYGARAAFAPGSAERLGAEALRLLGLSG
ncbi:alkaline ceramidase [Actinopolymorpha sp. NPDC004070]|uniref:alkaline ceramidase n=1 Tax=Actinopolymorpha sp. NPDC004070 TaxID=3154548 RepID=UPI0033BD7BB4